MVFDEIFEWRGYLWNNFCSFMKILPLSTVTTRPQPIGTYWKKKTKKNRRFHRFHNYLFSLAKTLLFGHFFSSVQSGINQLEIGFNKEGEKKPELSRITVRTFGCAIRWGNVNGHYDVHLEEWLYGFFLTSVSNSKTISSGTKECANFGGVILTNSKEEIGKFLRWQKLFVSYSGYTEYWGIK